MKMKKFLIILIAFVTMFVVAGCEDEPVKVKDTYYTLAVEYDNTKGNVQYAVQEQGYLKDSSVVLTITANETYSVSQVTVNDVNQELSSDSVYTVVMTSNITVKVEFAKDTYYTLAVNPSSNNLTYKVNDNVTTEVTNHLEGATVTVELTPTGEYEIANVKVNGEEKLVLVDPVTNSMKLEVTMTENVVIEVALSEKIKLISQAALDSISGKVKISGQYELVYKDTPDEVVTHSVVRIFEETKVSLVETDLATGEVLYNDKIVNSNGMCGFVSHTLKNEVKITETTESFDDYDNPFKDLTVEDFTYVSEGKYQLDTDLDDVASCISGWVEPIATFYVYVENDKVVKIEFQTKEITIEAYEVTYTSTYSFDVSEHQTAETGIITEPYEKTAEHELLEEALKNLTNNYTVHHVDIWPGEDDVEYYIYVDDKAIYVDYSAGNDRYGWVELNNYLYEFTYADDKVTIGDALAGYDNGIADAYAVFNSFNVEVLRYVGDGRYVTDDESLAAAIASWIGNEPNEQRLGAYVTYLEMIIQDGKLYQVKYNYSVYGYLGTVINTYSEIGTTTVSVNFDEFEQVSILDKYVGTYTNSDAENKMEIVITTDGITFNGTEFVVTDFETASKIFTGTVNDKTYYIAVDYYGATQILAFDDEEFLVTFTLVEDKEVVIPDEYLGEWANIDHHALITANSLVIDGVTYALSSYSEETGIIASANSKTYYIFLEEGLLYVSASDLTENYSLTYIGEYQPHVIPSDYIGVWKDRDGTVEVVITSEKIVVNGVEYVIETYDNYSGYTGTLGEVSEYMISLYYNESLMIGTMDENWIVYRESETPDPTPTPTPTPSIQEAHVGTYKSEDGTYEIVITLESITVNGEAYVLEAYDDYEGYTGKVNGVTYYIGIYTDSIMYMNDYESEDFFHVSCAKQQ